jgi:hypothetical protein
MHPDRLLTPAPRHVRAVIPPMTNATGRPSGETIGEDIIGADAFAPDAEGSAWHARARDAAKRKDLCPRD